MRALWITITTLFLIPIGMQASDTLVIRHIQLSIGIRDYPVTILQPPSASDSCNSPILISSSKETQKVIWNTTDRDQKIQAAELGIDVQIRSGEMVSVRFPAVTRGTWSILKSVDPGEDYAGLSTLVGCPSDVDGWFYWNLKSYHQGTLERIRRNESFSIPRWPTAFTINNRGYPQTAKDTLSHVKGKVGDTLRIIILNSSPSHHSLHFHGYHVRIVHSSVGSMEGWIKDTFPMLPGEVKVVELVPHQPGAYPVHDHNLVSVTMDGNYPGGMIATIMITP